MPVARNATVAAACLGWLFSAVDVILLILFQKQVAASLNVDAQAIHMVIGVGLMGSAVGGIVFAQLGDKFGRVRVLGWSVVLYSLATAGMGLAPSLGVLMGLRFLAGVGTGGEWSLGFALIAEVWPKERRGTLGGIVAAMFNLGTFLAIGLYQSGIGWRAAFMVMALPAIGVVILRMRVPESPVWLELQKARADGKVDAKLETAMKRVPISALFRGKMRSLTLKTTLLFLVMNFAFFGFATVFINFLQHEVAAPGKWLVAVGGLGLTPKQELPYQLVLNISSLVSIILAGYVSDRIGRRHAFAFVCLIGVVGYGILYMITKDANLAAGPPAGMIFAFAIVTASFGVNGVIGPMSSELYPTYLRSTGPGFCQNVGKGIGGMAGPMIAGALVPTLGYPKVLALPGLLLLLLAGLIWLLPKVGGRELVAVEDDAYLS